MEDLFGGESISYIILSTWQKWQGQDFFNLFAPPFCAFRQPKTHPLIVNLREVHPQKRPKSKHREQEKSLCFKSLIRQTMKSKKMRFFSKNNTKNKIIPILPSPLYTPACLTISIPSHQKGYFVICYFVIFWCFRKCRTAAGDFIYIIIYIKLNIYYSVYYTPCVFSPLFLARWN